MTLEQFREDDQQLVVRADTDSWVSVVADVARLATNIADTEFVPRGLRGKPAAVAAAVLSGREIGLPPMTALQVTHVIEGKPGLSAEGMRALVFAAGHVIEFVKSTGAECVIRGRRRYAENWTEVIWTLDMARAAGIVTKDVWKRYPRTQLQARATTELCRMIFPDVIHGFRSIEELTDMSDVDTATGELSAPTNRAVSRRTSSKRAAPSAARATPPQAPTEQTRTPPLPGESGYDETPPAQRQPVEDADDATSDERSDDAAPRTITRPQLRMLHATWTRFDLHGDEHRDERLRIVEQIVRREITSTSELTNDEAKALLDTLGRLRDREALDELIASVNKAEQEQAPEQESDES